MSGAADLRRLTWYTKPDCGLCDEAWPHVAAAAATLRIEIAAVDVIGDTELEAKYGHRLPVLAIGDQVLAEGRIGRLDAWGAVLRGRLRR